MGYDYMYGYDYGFGSVDMASVSNWASTIFLAALGIYALVIVLGIVSYVLECLGVYTIAQRRGIKHEWLAWLPYGHLWILGSISDQYQYVKLGQVTNGRKVMVGLEIAKTVLGLGVLGIYIKMVLDVMSTGLMNPAMMDVEQFILPIVLMALCGLAGWVLNIILIVFRYISLYNLFASCRPKAKVAFILLSILLGFTEPFLVFACRKKDGGMPPRKDDPVVTIEAPVVEETVVEEPVVEEPVVEETVVEEPVVEEPAVEPTVEVPEEAPAEE